MKISSEFIRQTAYEEGFSLCGIARCRVLAERIEPFDRWLDAGMESGMEYMRRYRDRRFDPSALVEGAKTVVACAVNYKNHAWNQTAVPRIASYAYAPDYHTTVKGMLARMLERIAERYPDVGGQRFSDTAPLLEKSWAVEAGLGWIGKNSLLITPRYGSFVVLGELVIDAECDDYDRPYAKDGCGTCRRCMDACPNGAIVSPRVIDTGRCIARLTNERMPEEPPLGSLHGWLAGCDECQSCCPYNRDTPMFTNPRFAPVIDPTETTPAFWRTLAEQDFNRLFGHTPLKRKGFAVIKSRIPEE